MTRRGAGAACGSPGHVEFDFSGENSLSRQELLMRKSVQVLGGVSLLVAGYVLGATQMLSPASLFAQGDARKPASGVAISDEAKTKIKTASDALKAAMDALIDDNKYSSATKGVNCFAVMTGGGNAM